MSALASATEDCPVCGGRGCFECHCSADYHDHCPNEACDCCNGTGQINTELMNIFRTVSEETHQKYWIDCARESKVNKTYTAWLIARHQWIIDKGYFRVSRRVIRIADDVMSFILFATVVAGGSTELQDLTAVTLRGCGSAVRICRARDNHFRESRSS